MAEVANRTEDAALAALLAFWAEAGVETEASPPLRPPALARPSAPTVVAKPARPASHPPLPATEDPRALAAAAADLPALAGAIAAFDGCGLKRTARQAVTFDGAMDAKVLVIGEGPGQEEDALGKPFVGRSGQLLDRMFAAIGLSRAENLLITNVVFWRPPGNRKPTQAEIAACLPFCERTVELVRPRLVLLIGGVAAEAMLKRPEGPTRLRGKRLSFGIPALTEPLNAMVMLHPAYLLRRPQDKRLAWADLLAAETWLNELVSAK